MDSCVWRYNKLAANVRPPLAYFPRIVIYILKLIHDLKRQTTPALSWKELDREITGESVNVPIVLPSCHVHSEKVPLPSDDDDI